MIEYITQTGIFGMFWIIIFIVFIGSLIKFTKTNGLIETFVTINPIVIILFLSNFMANELIGKSDFDMGLMFIKDMWFVAGHLFILTALMTKDKNCIEFWKYKKTNGGVKNDGGF